MISQESLAIVEATVEVVREHGTAITQRFYTNLFNSHPELKNLFNMGNQASGKQQEALAGAVYAYAANIQRPDALEPVLNRIAHKHCSLGIQPHQYTVVGKHLLQAIQEVLGDAITPAILAAWEEAYWLLACDLVSREARLYASQEAEAGEHYWQKLTISKTVNETDDIVSLFLQAEDAAHTIRFKPGQYISVAVPQDHAEFTKQIRQYSLSDSADKQHIRLTVKKETGQADGLVSTRIHELQAGDHLYTGKPYGDFVLQDEPQATVFISAGVGITPNIAMLNTLASHQSQEHIHFYHAAYSPNNVALKADIRHAHKQLTNLQSAFFFETGQEQCQMDNSYSGYMDLTDFALPHDAHYYLCGPVAFMQAQRKTLLERGIEATCIHYEVFGPGLLAELN